ncbi:retinal Mueller cells isomerohydrolase [Caerostris extrusa]|uniref:Retinal Mueller cells isomerohydrolase n=1 Tax=Caerostris extrusa TaxID=172846 RepID=A0AAV4MT83_CAEEX|nr:retinal Mueller cells isomerohydrolase [Caerostris extrusa]
MAELEPFGFGVDTFSIVRTPTLFEKSHNHMSGAARGHFRSCSVLWITFFFALVRIARIMERLFRSVEQNPVPQDADIIGDIPDWVEGQLFRLGPAKWDFDEDFSLNHWLDGSALLYKFTIRKGRVDVMSRFLDTLAYQKITQIKRPVFTEFGTKSYPDPCKNVFSRFFFSIGAIGTDGQRLGQRLSAGRRTLRIFRNMPYLESRF